MAEQEDLQTAIENIQNSLIERTDEIIHKLATGENTNSNSSTWVEYANQLRRLTPDYATPAWVVDACTEFGERFHGIPLNVSKIAEFVTTRAPEIRKPILVGEAASLNLEGLFAEQSKRFQLDQIFENLVSRLSELIKADVIDNRVVDDSLKRLNALFRRTKNGSLSTVLLTMNFGRFFLKSFGGILKANKYAKPVIESFENEFAEASDIVQKAEEETKKQMVLRLINPQRMDLFIDSNPDLKEIVAGFLPDHRENETYELGDTDPPATALMTKTEGDDNTKKR